MFVCMYVCVCMYMYVHTCTDVSMYVCMYAGESREGAKFVCGDRVQRVNDTVSV